jgi:hypothetical protein
MCLLSMNFSELGVTLKGWKYIRLAEKKDRIDYYYWLAG